MNETCTPEMSSGAISASATRCCTACGGVFTVPRTQICLECGAEPSTATLAERITLTLTLCLLCTVLLLLGAWMLA